MGRNGNGKKWEEIGRNGKKWEEMGMGIAMANVAIASAS